LVYKNTPLQSFVCFFRSSTPISNRVNDEPTKAPTVDLFDAINTSDYSEKQ